MNIKDTLKRLICNHENHDHVFIRNIYGDEINQLNARSIWMCNNCHTVIYKPKLKDIGEFSDGYHTFNELHHHRAILTAVICNKYKDKCWKSLKHSVGDGEMYTGMFIVGIETPMGTATYHYDVEPYWFLFNVKELYRAPKWDGHTPAEAIKGIESLITEDAKRYSI